MAKLTKWFPPEVKPVRHGWYERDYHRPVPAYSYWNGRFWSSGVPYLMDNQMTRNIVSPFQSKHWRGLAHPPKGA
jgi:hypothetical protein